MAFDLNPIKRRTGDKAVQKGDELVYLQRVIAPELRAIRLLLDQMTSSGLEYSAATGGAPGLQTAVPSANFVQLTAASTSTSQAVRMVFSAAQYPTVNLSRSLAIYAEYWVSADGPGGAPEVTLYNEGTGIEINGARVFHLGGATAARYLVGPLAVGDGAGDIPDEETVFTVRARDSILAVNVIVEQARLLVRFE
jgi:hypothetical protein